MTLRLEGSAILIADDEEPIRDLLRDILEPEGAAIRVARSGKEALEVIEADEPDVAILDVRMPPPDGLAVLQTLRAKGLDLPVLIITAQDSSTMTIDAMQRGAYDYLGKPFDPDEILHTVQRAVEHRRLTRRVLALERQVTQDPRDILIGRSGAMQQVYKLIGRVANSDATVLITGESGTGKELVAQVLHRSSNRREGPFVAVNCAALPETLLESELFGHEKGSFTGAMAQRKGRFEQATRGTIFLDEIGEISPATQKKLLRVLQERTFERVGGNAPIKADVRVLAATNRDLLEETRNGTFREDLYYRLNVVNINMPSLRERKEDIPVLVDHFLHKHRFGDVSAHITEAAFAAIMDQEWPGNVRQLENTIERAVVLAQGGLIGHEHLLLGDSASAREQILDGALARLIGGADDLPTIVANVRRRLITLALERTHGDHAAAARLLGISAIDLGKL
ncbi:MAG: sigma-54-dependent Fis family transcriptional regulator [Chloroflexales bacterium]|nr:sigma-54-dependent Fis family transcriptional regulator [Chloroflexales bacterium]